jgi:lipopolysaccharide export system protein LptA
MLKRLSIISVLFIILFVSGSFAEVGKEKIKGPIVVTSETLLADNKANTALFETNVVAKTADMTLYADKMLVHYTENGGEITIIEATGNIKLHKSTRLITSKEAVYYAKEDKIIFKGEPKAVDGDNVVTGATITYFINDDRSSVQGPKVILKNKKDK